MKEFYLGGYRFLYIVMFRCSRAVQFGAPMVIARVPDRDVGRSPLSVRGCGGQHVGYFLVFTHESLPSSKNYGSLI